MRKMRIPATTMPYHTHVDWPSILLLFRTSSARPQHLCSVSYFVLYNSKRKTYIGQAESTNICLVWDYLTNYYYFGTDVYKIIVEVALIYVSSKVYQQFFKMKNTVLKKVRCSSSIVLLI